MTDKPNLTKYIDPRTNETFPLEIPIWRSPSGNPLMLTPLPAITGILFFFRAQKRLVMRSGKTSDSGCRTISLSRHQPGAVCWDVT
ncbi:MAG: hypothetical protein HOD92_27050 [Deltaproteobacteria bacterium]|jgi:hypothetical protein|nr:hypothetical protein [Deltaproteobacteria bacterium]